MSDYVDMRDAVENFGTVPKWIWNVENAADMTRERIREELRNFRDADRNRGVMIVLWNNKDYGTEAFFERYRWSLEAARELGMTITLWDENGFPSGQAGGTLTDPDCIAWRLDMRSVRVAAGETARLPLDLGEYGAFLGAVAVMGDAREDVTALREGGEIAYTAKADARLCAFVCVPDDKQKTWGGENFFVNYLEPGAVDELIARTHDVYYARFPEYFGSVIRYAFYDEPSLYHVTGARAWTRHFNEWFERDMGYSPVLSYPALFMDVGPDTASARCALFGYRAKLYAENYVGRLSAWCDAHNIELTGHMDQEEIPNHVMLSGDLMYTLSRQKIPGVDSIFFPGRSSKPFRLVGSIPWNFGGDRVMCEAYGAMSESVPIRELYKEGMDMMARGINFLVPHGTWYENEKNVIFPPELSYRSARYGAAMPALDTWFARCCKLLSGGAQVCDTGLYVPVESMTAGSVFDDAASPYLGGRCASPTNYMDLGEQLISLYHVNLVYVHPLAVRAGRLAGLKTLILPDMDAISADALAQIVAFAESGGRVCASGRLPRQSAEPGCDAEVTEGVNRLQELGIQSPMAAGAQAKLSDPSLRHLYLRKEKDGRDLYFVCNMDDRPFSGDLLVEGEHRFALYDPHRDLWTTPRQRTEAGKTRVYFGMPDAECRFLREMTV